MKRIAILSICICLLGGCKDKGMPAQYLTDISVVRQGSNAPASSAQREQKTSVQAKPEKASPAKVIPPTPSPETRVAENQYHIIVASFKATEKAKAEETATRLKRQGHPASVVASTERFRVSIKSFPTEQAANAALDRYREITGREDIWVYKTP